MAVIRDNRGSLLASNISKYLAGAANTAGTPVDTHQIVKIVNQFLGESEQITPNVATISVGVYKKFSVNDKITNRTQVVTSGIWSGDTGSLMSVYTSSTQVASDSGKYYINAYNLDPTSNTSAEVQFSVAYGDINGYGAPSLAVDDNSLMSTKAIYAQYKNILLNGSDQYFSVYSGSIAGGHNLQSFYAININRARYKERLDPGNISLTLQGGKGTTVLIDDSGGTDENVTTAGRVYNIVSGSLNIGSALSSTTYSPTASNKQGFGLFYPDMGIILLNPAALSASVDASLKTTGSTTPLGVYYNQTAGSGSRRLIECINNGADFQVRRTENVSTSHYFIRANNREYNFSNNPSFITGSAGQFVQGTFEKDPHVYITSVGLYDDANELLAVAKLSSPVEKSFDKEIAIKVKLDF
jgi:hypothetical protein